jgi:acyl-CoA oxidase
MEDYKMAEYLNDEMLPYTLTPTMFATTVREQGSDEQKAQWMPLIDTWKILGAYGQTELGHGSNVKGLECQAIWQPKTKDFIIHSPTLTASKVQSLITLCIYDCINKVI